ncbi:hypothetical protein SNOUR_25445 [Streptomyces noursei ATCC 11455]|uniref:hypothetical protein n=1 Tax=Streptomyces noursei TaxID=1971 RepID=UPI00081D2567|nr:hypothetical protein SNOUR_25445 [Streptomyces noursei ATCC 11455]
MNNSPGWASPGSSPSDEPGRGTPEQPIQPPAPEDRSDAAQQPTPPNWSSNQPPPGQWTTPAGIPGQSGPGGRSTHGAEERARASSGSAQAGWTAPPGPGGQGTWGGGPGWGGGWSAMPPVAKPGVIPLRPLGVGEILDGAVATMRAHWRTVLGISLIVAVISQTAVTVVTGLWFPSSGLGTVRDDGTRPPLRQVLSEMGNSLTGSAISALIGLLGTIIATGMLTMVISRAVLGRPVTAGGAWSDARGQLPRLLGLLVLLPLIISAVFMAGMTPGIIVTSSGSLGLGLGLMLLGLFAAGVVSIWLWVRFSLASPALMLEKQGVIASMRRSAKLVRGSWWRVLGVQLLAYLLISIVQFIIQIPATFVAFLIGGESLMDWADGTSNSTGWPFLIALGIGAIISSAITFPISAGVTSLLYVDQRIRREALDLELARAAGLPGYSPETPAAPPATGGTRPPGTTAPDATPAARPAAEALSARPAAESTDPTGTQPTDRQPAKVQLTKTQADEAENAASEKAEPATAETPDAPGAPTDASPDIPGPRTTDSAPGS